MKPEFIVGLTFLLAGFLIFTVTVYIYRSVTKD